MPNKVYLQKKKLQIQVVPDEHENLEPGRLIHILVSPIIQTVGNHDSLKSLHVMGSAETNILKLIL